MPSIEISDLIKEKLFEFNFSITSSYKIDNTEELMIITEDMIIAVNDKAKSTAISFEATTRPDVAAKRMLILKEVEQAGEIYIMEPYVFENNQLVTGEKALEIAHSRLGRQTIADFMKKQIYNEIIKTEKCGEC